MDFEKAIASDSDSPSSADDALDSQSIVDVPIIDGRPDIKSLVRTEIDATPSHNSVLVMGCGPNGLMTDLRNITASCIRTDGPAVELHCEQFGW